ncbi:uncharacterized protein LOC127877469 [Dreissena polymorpha]|uniref:uncharacterized protein LOC127877469 n=1 Tax=Dreissena polymorpha TaxID=45954 RepID=UPI0022656964|nr:uncharacterized protein LOC127877469 [Dreissena polymorpha]
MDSQINETVAEVKTDTECIHAVLLQIVNSQAGCSCKDKITEFKKDLDALKERVSTMEEEYWQVKQRRDEVKNARARRLGEHFTQLEHIQSSIGSMELNRPSGTGAGSEYEERMRSTERTTSVSDFGASSPSLKPEKHTNRVCVKRQSERRNSMDVEKWQLLGRQEIERVSLMPHPHSGYHTVLLLDISESMASGDSWKNVKTFVNDFLSGLEEHSALSQRSRHRFNEHVSLVTFGHQTHVETPMTKDFKVIRNKIDQIALGGPSPLLGGLLVAQAVLMSVQGTPSVMHNISMHHKVIVLTDGQPTEMSLYSGPDVVDETKLDEDMANIVMVLDILHDAKMSVFFVDVPNCATTFFPCIRSDAPYRNVFYCNEGRRLARRNYLCTTKMDDLESVDENLTAEDKEDLRDIVSTTNAHAADAINRACEHRITGMYRESNCKTLPIIGSRVRRGPDWKWKNQDSNGVGTVVGHWDNETWVTVEWDAKLPGGNRGYQYGEGRFDLLIVDEIRRLQPGELLAVGCQVKTGRHGKFRNVHAWNKGVVIEMKPPKARVRWDSGIRRDYSYGEDGRFEIEIWDSASSATTLTESDKELASGLKSKNKNKRSK